MRNIKIKLPFLLTSNLYFGVVISIIILWVYSKTIRNAEGFTWVVFLIGTLIILNGVANIILEEVGYSDTYIIKDKNKILSAENSINYVSLFLFLVFAKFWFTMFPIAGHVLFITLVSPLFLAICYVLATEIKTVFANGFSPSTTLLSFAFLFYILGNNLRHTIANAFGEERIGSFFEKSNYTTKYYINLFPNKNEVKSYRLPADIHVYHEEYGDDEYSTSIKCIRIEKAFFPNGGFIRFNNEDDSQYDNLVFGEKVNLIDSNSKEWYVELIDKKVN